VQERMTDVEGKHFKMGVDVLDIIGQCSSSLMTVATVVEQAEGDKYPTSSLILPFMNSCMRSLSEDAPLSRVGWALQTCAENFPCHQRRPVSNQYAKTSVRTWRIGGSQI